MGRVRVFLIVTFLFITACSAGKVEKRSQPGSTVKDVQGLNRNKKHLRQDGPYLEASAPESEINENISEAVKSPIEHEKKLVAIVGNSKEITLASQSNKNNETPNNGQALEVSAASKEAGAGSTEQNNDDENSASAPDKLNASSNDNLNNNPESKEASGQVQDDASDKRPLKAGDTFTPFEFLPVAKKLIAKVENPGEGTGIVSSVKDPRALADILFESFFLGPSRIVIIKGRDIAGLDAFQALALSGDEARRIPEYSTEPAQTMYFRDQYIKVNNEPRKSKYMLLSKPVSGKRVLRSKNTKNTKKVKKLLRKQSLRSNQVFRSRFDLQNKLQKKRHLIVNPSGNSIIRKRNLNSSFDIKIPARAKGSQLHAKSNQLNKKLKPYTPKFGLHSSKQTAVKKVVQVEKQKVSDKLSHSKVNAATPKPHFGTTLYPKTFFCRWRYECRNPADLDTCRLRTECNKNKINAPAESYIGRKETVERAAAIKRFRRMVNISPVDEEVEKILEARVLQLRGSSVVSALAQKEGVANIESLSQYFNNILMREYRVSTTQSSDNENEEVSTPQMDSAADQKSDGVTEGANENDVNTPQADSGTGQKLDGKAASGQSNK